MYNFLSRLGRLLIGITVLVAIIAIFGVTTDLGPLVSHHQNAPSAACAVSMGGVINGHQRLLVAASGLNPNSSYVYGQTGIQTATVTTNSSGAFSDQSLFYNGPGKYAISVDYYYWSNNKLVQAIGTSCSGSF